MFNLDVILWNMKVQRPGASLIIPCVLYVLRCIMHI